jgi:hypothetical protein
MVAWMPDHARPHRIELDLAAAREQKASLSIGAARWRPSHDLPVRRQVMLMQRTERRPSDCIVRGRLFMRMP